MLQEVTKHEGATQSGIQKLQPNATPTQDLRKEIKVLLLGKQL